MRRRAIIQMIVIGVLAGIVTGAVAYFVPWLPDAASTQAGLIDEVYWFVAIICVVIFALVAGVALYAGWKFRAADDDLDDGSPIHGHTGLEICVDGDPDRARRRDVDLLRHHPLDRVRGAARQTTAWSR